MALMHHPILRVNSDQFTADTFPIHAESGWVEGPHPDTDPDDDRPVPAVLPEQPARAKRGATAPAETTDPDPTDPKDD